MADIELIIKIPTEIYEASQILDVKHEDTIQIPLEVIANGTPLPKWHGRLIDVKCVKKEFNDKEGDDFTAFHFYDALDNAQTIIPADKACGMTDRGHVLKTEEGLYYCGMNIFDKQLRMAKIYHSKRYAQDAKETMEQRNGYHISLVRVEISEKDGD